MTLSENSIDDIFSNVGIDSIGFYSPNFYLNLEELAKIRDVNPDKYKFGLMANEMRFSDYGEDCISIGLKAAYNSLLRGNINVKEIDAVFVGTEASIYSVKSISNIFKDLLGIPKHCITQDISNACAAGTLSIMNAIGMIESGIINKALIISVDISKYDLKSPGEPTQGAGALAMIISRNPRIAVFGKHFGKISGNINDFFIPNGEDNAQVFGQYSVQTYLKMQLESYDNLIDQIGKYYADYYIFHSPYSKLPLKLMQKLIALRALDNIDVIMKHKYNESFYLDEVPYFNTLSKDFLINEEIKNKLNSLNLSPNKRKIVENWIYNKIRNTFLPPLQVSSTFGNLYSASIWTEFMYVIENCVQANDTIYFGSYGSGAISVSGLLKIQPKFMEVLSNSMKLSYFMQNKTQKTVEEYENLKNKTEDNEKYIWVKMTPIHEKQKFGFNLRYCNEGCNLTLLNGLNNCPKGHNGNKLIFFPILGKANIKKKFIEGDISPLFDGYVLMYNNPDHNSTNLVEFEMRRWKNTKESNPKHGLLNWIPIYRYVDDSPYLSLATNEIPSKARISESSAEYSF